jgi:hypothetical protein
MMPFALELARLCPLTPSLGGEDERPAMAESTFESGEVVSAMSDAVVDYGLERYQERVYYKEEEA